MSENVIAHLSLNLSCRWSRVLEASDDTNVTAAVASVDSMNPLNPINPWDLAFCITGSIIAAENSVVIAAILHTPTLREPMFLLIGSLATADLLAGLGLIFYFIFQHIYPSDMTSLTSVGLLVASFSASVCSLLAITIDRYLSLYYALTYSAERTASCTYVMIVLTWVVSSLLGLLPALGWNCLKDMAACSIIRPLTKNHIVFLAVTFLLVFALMLQLYTQICKIVCRHAQQIALQHHFLTTSHYVTTRKGISTLAIILGTFAACWMPFSIYSLVGDISFPSIYTYATLLPATYNSAINPVIYAFRNHDIQKALLLLCCGCLTTGVASRARTPSDV
uniref:G-protein coupled receptor 12-like n=1 Tax=Myxine glutinosa TaxID=7769 RepID=UPI00358EB873